MVRTKQSRGTRRGATLLFLHLLMAVYSCSSLFSKTAARYSFTDIHFLLCYAGMIGVLGIYAIGWQQVIKRIPLTSAYAHRAVTVVWGIVWGVLFFGEKVSSGKLLGAAMILAGIVLYARADFHQESENEPTEVSQ